MARRSPCSRLLSAGIPAIACCCVLIYALLGTGLKALCLIDKQSTTELLSQPSARVLEKPVKKGIFNKLRIKA